MRPSSWRVLEHGQGCYFQNGHASFSTPLTVDGVLQQESFDEILIALTTVRPGALVESGYYRGICGIAAC